MRRTITVRMVGSMQWIGYPALIAAAATILFAIPLRLFGSYHVSQQNTFTGRLTPAMLEDVLSTAVEFAGL